MDSLLARLLAGLAAVALIALLPAAARATTLPSGFAETDLASGLTTPASVAWAPDGRMFIAERQGIVMVHNPGDPPATNHQLIDISDHVNSAPNGSNDRGLLGIAVDRDFASNHFLYLLYTYDTNTSDDNNPKTSTLTRITVNADDTTDGVETTILGHDHPSNGVCPAASNTSDCIPSDGTSHSIGTIRVAPDGTLFVGSGTGASYTFADPLSLRAYDEQSFAGKIMHVDRNGNGLPGHPFCPSDTNLSDVCTKIYAKGLRNPFRFALRPGGGLAVGDVGQDTWEELNLVPPGGGGDYGWPCYEGANQMPLYRDDPATQAACAQEYAAGTALAPSFSFPHPDASFCPCGPVVGETVIGGPEYAGDQYPLGFRGSLFLGNFKISDSTSTGWIDRVILDSSGNVASVVPFATDWPVPDQISGVDLETAPDGNLVYVSIAEIPGAGGFVREIKYLPGNAAPVAGPSASVTSGAAPLAVSFKANAGDPDGDPLHYDWDFGDGSAHSGDANPVHTFTAPGHRTVTLTVDDQRGKSASATLAIDVAAAPPGGGTKARKIRYRLSRGAGRLAKRGLIRGSFKSAQAIRVMEVAIWRGKPGSSKCRWWSRSRKRLVSGHCGGLHFIRATLSHRGSNWTFTLKLGRRLPAGRYTLVLEAIPRGTREAKAGRRNVSLRVPR